MGKVWTEEERRRHGEKIRATKRANREKQELFAPPAMPSIEQKVIRTVVRHALLWSDLPFDARKSARNPRVPENTPVVKARCVNCRLDMWTRDPKIEDMCETCEFLLIQEKHKLRQQAEKSRGGRHVNPFSESSNVNPVVNPFLTGGKLL